jgi:hypothetical protein
MISSFVYVGREALEMMFLTLMVTSAISMNYKIYTAAIVGILSGIVFGIFLGEVLEPYEVLMYGLLSALMFYLFFTSKDLAAHVKQHVDDIAQNQTGVWAGLFTIWFIYARESMEVFVFMFQTANNTFNGWIGAVTAAVIVAVCFPLIRKYIPTATLFTVTRYAFLVFGIWFGYEAWEHM